MKTTIDYLTFRTQAEPREALEALRPMFGTVGPDLSFRHLQRGSMGFQQAAQIVLGDMPVARLDFGGDSQRGWVRTEMTGKGCEWVQDWDGNYPSEAVTDPTGPTSGTCCVWRGNDYMGEMTLYCCHIPTLSDRGSIFFGIFPFVLLWR